MTTLSYRAKELLLVVDEATEFNDAQELQRYFVPQTHRYHTPLSKYGFSISGSGDARIFKSLHTKGLIKPMRAESIAYAYAITEDGRIAANEIKGAL